jgi:hypothetical protein
LLLGTHSDHLVEKTRTRPAEQEQKKEDRLVARILLQAPLRVNTF